MVRCSAGRLFPAGPVRSIMGWRNLARIGAITASGALEGNEESGISHSADHAIVAKPDAISILA